MHPDRIGPYQIDRKVGSGGMGNVYHGVHEVSGQEAAVKVLPASMAREEGFVPRFTREIEALRKLSSPYIVRLFEDGQHGDSWYFSMEFVDGETLTSMITRRRKIPWPEVIDLTIQIARALKSAHDAGVVHRDLKPSNLMITSDGTVKLTDFGVAQVFAGTRLTRAGGVVGTAEYMSPEQSRGQRTTKRSDLYSLGAVMYAMLAGRPPFSGRNADEILRHQQFTLPDRVRHYAPETPHWLDDLVHQLLDKQPDKRVPDAFVLIRRLEQIRDRVAFRDSQTAAPSPTGSETSGGTAGTASDALTAELPGDPAAELPGPGPATIMRDAIRAEAEAAAHRSPVARFFDNTLVLVLLLAGLIALGFWLRNRNQVSPEARLASAVSAFEKPAGRGWMTARDDLLQPLLDEGSLPDSEDQIRSMIQKADQYEFTRSLHVADASASLTPDFEVRRLIRDSFAARSAGDLIDAERQMQSVHTLIADREGYEFLSDFVEQTLTSWQSNSAAEPRRQLISNSLQRARQLASSGQAQKARQLLTAMISLYDQDEAVTDLVADCRTLEASIPSPPGDSAAEASSADSADPDQ